MFLTSAPLIVTLDACVWYGMPLRDTLLRAAEKELYRPTWTHEILDEVVRHLKDPTERERPLTEADAARLLAAVEKSFPEAFVSNYEGLIATMRNNPKDRHVAAAAVHAHAHVIVTYNLKDFPATALAPYSIEAQHPDEFLTSLYDRAPEIMALIIQEQAAALRKKQMSPQEVLAKLEYVGITQFARAVHAYLDQNSAG